MTSLSRRSFVTSAAAGAIAAPALLAQASRPAAGSASRFEGPSSGDALNYNDGIERQVLRPLSELPGVD